MPDVDPFVFISYSHADEKFATEFSARLKKAGLQHFIDRRSILWGDDIPDQVHRALERATHLVVLISPGSERSQWVAYEMGFARGKKVKIVPYLLHPSMQMPGFISSIKYLQDAKDETEFLSALRRKRQATSIKRPAGVNSQPGLPAANDQKPESVESRLSSTSGDVRRAAVVEMGERGDRRYVALIKALLQSEKNQNIRESAIKALGGIGGEQASTFLEEIWLAPEVARFGRGAAKNALKQLNLWGSEAPLLKPATINDVFISLRTTRLEQDTKRDRAKQELIDEIMGKKQADLFRMGVAGTVTTESVKLKNFHLFWAVTRLQQQWYYRIRYTAETSDLFSAQRLISWEPLHADEMALRIKEQFDVKKAASRARDIGFDVELLLNNRIRVSGSDWPCFRPGLTHERLTLDFTTEDSNSGCTIQCGSLPWGIDSDWTGCVRLLVRCLRLLQL